MKDSFWMTQLNTKSAAALPLTLPDYQQTQYWFVEIYQKFTNLNIKEFIQNKKFVFIFIHNIQQQKVNITNLCTLSIFT